MDAIWYLTTRSWRQRVRDVILLTLLVALPSGMVLASLAAANRTSTAYDRFVDDTDGWDLLVNPDNGTESALDGAAVAAHPQVEAAGRVDGLFAVRSDAQSLEDVAGGDGFTLWGTDRSVFRELARPLILDGRMPDIDAPDEVFVNPVAAEKFGLSPGDRFGVKVFGFDDLATVFDVTSDEAFREIMADPSIGHTVDLEITGIGIGPDDVAAEPAFRLASIYSTPAFAEAYAPIAFFWGSVVQLVDQPGAAESFKRDINEMVPNEVIVYQSNAATRDRIEHAVRPYVVSLRLFAGLATVIGLVLVTQAIGRALEVGRPDLSAGRALGQTRSQRAAVAFGWTSLPLVAGTLLGLAIAWLMSPLGPIGPVRDAEIEPGLRFEVAVLPLGALVSLAALTLVALVRSWRTARLAPDAARVSSSKVAEMLGRLGASVPVATGVRFGFERRSGSSAWSTRGVLVGGITAVMLAAGLLTFGASLDHFTRTPALFAQPWDVEVQLDGEAEDVPALVGEVETILHDSSDVDVWAWLRPNQVTLNELPVPAVAFSGAGGLEPTIRSGRTPTGPNEIALGASTADTLGVVVGDTVSATTPAGDIVQLTVVGEAVLPASGTYSNSDKTALGQGVLMAGEAMDRIAPTLDKSYAVVRLAAGGSSADLARSLADTSSGTTSVLAASMPSDVLNLSRLRGTPLILLALLGLSVSGGVLHALSTSFRQRRRDLAILRACGYRSSQVRSTSVWQALAITLVALVVGIPLGVVAGRISWVLLAGDIGILSEPRVPVPSLGALATTTLALAAVAGAVAGAAAARVSASALLRPE